MLFQIRNKKQAVKAVWVHAIRKTSFTSPMTRIILEDKDRCLLVSANAPALPQSRKSNRVISHDFRGKFACAIFGDYTIIEVFFQCVDFVVRYMSCCATLLKPYIVQSEIKAFCPVKKNSECLIPYSLY